MNSKKKIKQKAQIGKLEGYMSQFQRDPYSQNITDAQKDLPLYLTYLFERDENGEEW